MGAGRGSRLRCVAVGGVLRQSIDREVVVEGDIGVGDAVEHDPVGRRGDPQVVRSALQPLQRGAKRVVARRVLSVQGPRSLSRVVERGERGRRVGTPHHQVGIGERLGQLTAPLLIDRESERSEPRDAVTAQRVDVGKPGPPGGMPSGPSGLPKHPVPDT